MKNLFLILYGASVFASPDIDADGWVAVAPPPSEAISPAQEEDAGIWVVFAKQSGSEKILVSFPSAPTYLYNENGDMEIQGGECRLEVLKKTDKNLEELLADRQREIGDAVITRSESSEIAELTYWKEGWWHQERWIVTEHHTYFFHTKTASMDLALHTTFIDSFDLYRS